MHERAGGRPGYEPRGQRADKVSPLINLAKQSPNNPEGRLSIPDLYFNFHVGAVGGVDDPDELNVDLNLNFWVEKSRSKRIRP